MKKNTTVCSLSRRIFDRSEEHCSRQSHILHLCLTQRKLIFGTSLFSHFGYCLVVWMFCNRNLHHQINQFKMNMNGAWEINILTPKHYSHTNCVRWSPQRLIHSLFSTVLCTTVIRSWKIDEDPNIDIALKYVSEVVLAYFVKKKRSASETRKHFTINSSTRNVSLSSFINSGWKRSYTIDQFDIIPTILKKQPYSAFPVKVGPYLLRVLSIAFIFLCFYIKRFLITRSIDTVIYYITLITNHFLLKKTGIRKNYLGVVKRLIYRIGVLVAARHDHWANIDSFAKFYLLNRHVHKIPEAYLWKSGLMMMLHDLWKC